MSARVSGVPDGGGVPTRLSEEPRREPFRIRRPRPHLGRGRQQPDAAAALERWRCEPALAAPDLDTLVDWIWAASKADADRAHAALAARAPSDGVAARVLLQTLRPGLRALGRRLALGAAFEDVDHELLALAWEQIRTYRIVRRPTAVAANILWDVRKRYVRAVVEPGRVRPRSRMWPMRGARQCRRPSTKRSTPRCQAFDGPTLSCSQRLPEAPSRRRAQRSCGEPGCSRTRTRRSPLTSGWTCGPCSAAVSEPSANSPPPAVP